ncbi:transcription factor EC-like [Ruditapes philippinarum]|uniref:transcription factor EC-like n=1 Tax=Ruditapes philippinarum TaxID=129788 RepID=UPI00295B36DD|nr:transcription factor EC-like [Ruditapes philippinarum]
MIPMKQQKDKEKKRKESHNRIEKKRMAYINEKISELESFLPGNAKRRSRQRKGLILKESIDYIKQIQQEQTFIQQRLQDKIEDTDNAIKNLLYKLQQVELQIQSSEKRQLHEEKVNETHVKQNGITTATFPRTYSPHTNPPTEVYTTMHRSTIPGRLCLTKGHY